MIEEAQAKIETEIPNQKGLKNKTPETISAETQE